LYYSLRINITLEKQSKWADIMILLKLEKKNNAVVVVVVHV
jgi:hypothetical protein